MTKIVQKHLAHLFVIVDEKHPVILRQEEVPGGGKILNLPGIISPKTDYFESDSPPTSLIEIVTVAIPQGYEKSMISYWAGCHYASNEYAKHLSWAVVCVIELQRVQLILHKSPRMVRCYGGILISCKSM